jgi:anaerobic selenocysteine-containing dehydrogenase
MKENNKIRTTCTMDCPDTCGLEVEVQNGKISKISGTRDHPVTNGFICSKVSNFAKRVYHKDRLLYPMKRIGKKGEGKFEKLSWDKAIHEIVEKFHEITKEYGSEAILPYHYGGSNGILGEEFMDDYFFAKLGASRISKTLCAVPTTEVATGMYGKMPGVAFEDYANANFILIWGANSKVSNIHLVPFLKKAKRKGAFIAVIDPVCNFSKNEVDLHLPVLPGTDLLLALGMINYWKKNGLLDIQFLKNHGVDFEKLLSASDALPLEKAALEAGVDLDDSILLCEKYAELSPAVLRCGWGVERNKNGGQAVAAILAISALLGKFGVLGGGYTMSNVGATKIDMQKIFGEFAWNSRILNMSQLGELLNGNLQPPVKSLFVYNCNPAVTAPDQNSILRGLAREDLFTVVHEQVMTDTAKFADILLPAPTFLEQYEIKKSYGSYILGGVQPAIPARGESKSNEEVFSLLGRAMGWDDNPFLWNTEQLIEKLTKSIQLFKEKPQSSILRNGESHYFNFPGKTPIQFKTVFPFTKDKKIHFVPDVLGEKPFEYNAVRNERYPLALISPGNSKMISSTMGEYNYKELMVTIHPDDAYTRDFQNGDIVRVFNQLGEVVCKAIVDNKIRKSVVSIPKGAWRYSSLNGKTATTLCPANVNVVGGGACFNDARVQIEKYQEK